jgi:hypothetical protein
MSGESSKQEIIEMILSAGLLEDFIKFLRERGVDLDDVKSIYNIEESVVREYAVKKRIVFNPDTSLDTKDTIEEEYEPRRVRPRTPPKRE